MQSPASTTQLSVNIPETGTLNPDANPNLNLETSTNTNANANASISSGGNDRVGGYHNSYLDTAWTRVRHFLTFALELQESQPIEPFESVLSF
ncbi:hypothetical protein AX774_g5664 [Zancudomyces culisetae]|uniref:Uncharacterized protein n=1 Tax=Zancudomyces culisetae TaxID=1213189 RepID=A0A1R1PIZ0_ZANCU|nr:hypothetical protein AX774_g5664 [Zancudomyces culisetae]|eukprot:OMH80889.1 hypothetical protein AX774_g5664 [Zancudomyces culisetae]